MHASTLQFTAANAGKIPVPVHRPGPCAKGHAWGVRRGSAEQTPQRNRTYARPCYPATMAQQAGDQGVRRQQVREQRSRGGRRLPPSGRTRARTSARRHRRAVGRRRVGNLWRPQGLRLLLPAPQWKLEARRPVVEPARRTRRSRGRRALRPRSRSGRPARSAPGSSTSLRHPQRWAPRAHPGSIRLSPRPWWLGAQGLLCALGTPVPSRSIRHGEGQGRRRTSTDRGSSLVGTASR